MNAPLDDLEPTSVLRQVSRVVSSTAPSGLPSPRQMMIEAMQSPSVVTELNVDGVRLEDLAGWLKWSLGRLAYESTLMVGFPDYDGPWIICQSENWIESLTEICQRSLIPAASLWSLMISSESTPHGAHLGVDTEMNMYSDRWWPTEPESVSDPVPIEIVDRMHCLGAVLFRCYQETNEFARRDPASRAVPTQFVRDRNLTHCLSEREARWLEPQEIAPDEVRLMTEVGIPAAISVIWAAGFLGWPWPDPEGELSAFDASFLTRVMNPLIEAPRLPRSRSNVQSALECLQFLCNELDLASTVRRSGASAQASRTTIGAGPLADLELARLLQLHQGELLVRGVPVSEATDRQIRQLQVVCDARSRALSWVIGDDLSAERYDELVFETTPGPPHH